jgi:putative ATPase
MDAQAGLRSGATPLAVRMRPKTLDEIAGQKHLLGAGSPLVSLASDKSGEQGSVSIILWGPPGTGKTTLAKVIAHSSGRKFVELSAVTAGRERLDHPHRGDDREPLVLRDLAATVAIPASHARGAR